MAILIGCCLALLLAWAVYHLESRMYLLLLHRLSFRPRYGPPFLSDLARHFPSHGLLETHWQSIRDELLRFLQQAQPLPRLHEIDPANHKISFAAGPAWNTIILKAYDGWFIENCQQFPQTVALLRGVPEVSTVLFSILQPGACIPPHTGKFSGIYRYHLALQVPRQSEQCYLELNQQRYYWTEGEGVLFDDTYLHSVRNTSDEPRAVLFLDIKRNSPLCYRQAQAAVLGLIRSSPIFKRALRSGKISVG